MLKPTDRLSIVTYDNSGKRLCPLKFANSNSDKETIIKKIDKLIKAD